MKCLRSGIFLLLFLLCATPSLARSVRVSTYSQLRAACQNALSGDVVLIAPGVYTIRDASRIQISNRPGPVLVKSATGRASDVVIEGLGQDNPAVPVAFDLDNSPRWTFEDLTARNTYYHGWKFDGASTDCVLRRCIMRDHGEGGVKGTTDPIHNLHPDRLLVEGCDIGWSNANGGTRDVVEGIDGVAVNDWTIRNNRFVNVQHGGAPAYGVFTKGNASRTRIEGNRFENCFIAASFGGGGTGPDFFRDNDRTYEHRDGLIANNVMIRCSDAGIYLNKARNARVFHNTLFECALSIQLRYPESSAMVLNNLVKPAPGSDEAPVRLRDGATLLLARVPQNAAQASNRLAVSADFVRPQGSTQTLDLHLRAGSNAVNAGVNAGAITRDKDGRRRPQGSAPDLGAYER